MSKNNNDSNLTFAVVENWLPAQMHKEYLHDYCFTTLSKNPKAKVWKTFSSREGGGFWTWESNFVFTEEATADANRFGELLKSSQD